MFPGYRRWLVFDKDKQVESRGGSRQSGGNRTKLEQSVGEILNDFALRQRRDLRRSY